MSKREKWWEDHLVALGATHQDLLHVVVWSFKIVKRVLLKFGHFRVALDSVQYFWSFFLTPALKSHRKSPLKEKPEFHKMSSKVSSQVHHNTHKYKKKKVTYLFLSPPSVIPPGGTCETFRFVFLLYSDLRGIFIFVFVCFFTLWNSAV